MTLEESDLIYNTIITSKPAACAEAGLGTATSDIARALKDNNRGVLYSYTNNKAVFADVVNTLITDGISFRVRPYVNEFIDGINKILVSHYDFVFIDGDNAACDNFKYLASRTITGSCVILYKWNSGIYANIEDEINANWIIDSVADDACKIIKK